MSASNEKTTAGAAASSETSFLVSQSIYQDTTKHAVLQLLKSSRKIILKRLPAFILQKRLLLNLEACVKSLRRCTAFIIRSRLLIWKNSAVQCITRGL